MIEKINIYNKQKQTGKTSVLKLKAIEASLNYYDKVIICSYTTGGIGDIKEDFKDLYTNNSISKMKFNQIGFIRTDLLVANLKGCNYKNILLLIDEPFNISLEAQNNLLHFLEESIINFHVIGYGTLNTNFKSFKDYIK